MTDISQILIHLQNSGFHQVAFDGNFIHMEDPSCIIRSFETFTEYAWIGITAIAGLLLFGWAISMIRGAKNDILVNLRNLTLIFGILAAVRPIVNLIYGDDLFGRGCNTISVSISEVQKILATRDFKFQSNLTVYENEPMPLAMMGDFEQYPFGGQCTPSRPSGVFANANFTTNQYANVDAVFNKAMNTIFRSEGGYVNDPFDSGGETKYGISKNNNPDIDVAKITRADAERIAYDRYYTKYGINRLPDTIRGEVFQVGWHCGPSVAIKQLQGILGVSKTGRIDDATITAAYQQSGNIRDQYINTYRDYMISITKRKPTQQRFLRGWMNRVELVRENGCHS